MISNDQLRELDKAGLLPERDFDLKPDPKTPKGFPKSFKESLHFKGACGVPLYDLEKQKWNYYACSGGGNLILYDGEFGEKSSFPNYEEALAFAKKYVEHFND